MVARTINRFPSAVPFSFAEIVSNYFRNSPARLLATIQDRSWCRLIRSELCAHFLEPYSKRFNLLFLTRDFRFLPRDLRFLLFVFAMLFEELVEQHRVHSVVAHRIR